MTGLLYLVPTPIGNLKDITFRAIDTLKSADLILAEDTRTSGKLLNHYAISTQMKAFHMHNEHKLVDDMIKLLLAGQNLAVVTDAGTPGISDPGYLISRKAMEQNIEVISLPGATAFVPALVNSGLAIHNFAFEGFLPPKKGRQTKLQNLATESRTMVFYESPYRMEKTLNDFIKYFGAERQASFSREISKKFEDTQRGSLKELLDYVKKNSPKGEFVLCVQGFKEN